MKPVATNVWPLEDCNYNETDFACLMAEAVTTSSIFSDEPRLPLEQFQPNEDQIQLNSQPQVQASPRPLPPFQSLRNHPVNFPVNFPTGSKSRRITLQERDPVDLRRLKEARVAKRKWQEEFWLQEEQVKIQQFIKNKDLVIFAKSEKARLAEKELARVEKEKEKELTLANSQLAKYKKIVTKCEERSRKVASANARILQHMSKN